MKKRHKYLIVGWLATVAIMVAVGFIATGNVPVLQTRGVIADQQKQLLITATLLMLLIVIPVFMLTIHIVWKYRADRHTGKRQPQYMPEWASNRKLEALWWGFPTLIILILSVMIWQTSHSLDPFRPLDSQATPLRVQVVALQWKWLFILPEQNIASVNYLRVPEDTPLNFEITADAPMNSFWVPQLGGQVYAMSGMTTRLHLEANEPGEYRGSSANLSGEGFAHMDFTVAAGSAEDFDRWVADVKSFGSNLGLETYNKLAQPSVPEEPTTYGSTAPGLHSTIVGKYAGSEASHHGSHPHQPQKPAQHHNGGEH